MFTEYNIKGLQRLLFEDSHKSISVLQEFSENTDYLCLGILRDEAAVLAKDADKVGIHTTNTQGYVEYPIPLEVSINNKLYLNRKQIGFLIDKMQHWLNTGKLF